MYDLRGKTFGLLTVIERSEKKAEHHGQSAWLCRCQCGKRCAVMSRELRTGHTKSCGCRKAAMCAEANVLHGAWKGVRGNGRKVWPEWRVWQAMKERCYSRKSVSYSYYGQRGIRVCKRWLASFKAFIDDMGRRPSARHSIDRIDNDGNYEPSNCRWATATEQRVNQRPRRRPETGAGLSHPPRRSSRFKRARPSPFFHRPV